LPVIAIYSIYEILIAEFNRYKNKNLNELKSHLASDMRSGSVGDIEIIDENDEYFEAVEIKHNKPANAIMIDDAYEKFKDKPISRYYLLTTSEPCIELDQKESVNFAINRIREENGCEVIVNGIIPSLKYYLRLLTAPGAFIEKYTYNLIVEFQKSTEIKEEHIDKWQKILGD